MTRLRRAFSAEFKQQAVRRVREREAAGKSLVQVGRELGIRPDLLRKWARTARDESGRGAASTTEALEAEVRRLQRENDGLRQEAAFVKKAAAYFARELR